MKVVKIEKPEKEDGEVLIIAIADNSLKDPIACIRHTLNEIMAAGHTVELFTYDLTNAIRMKDLRAFIKDLGLNEELDIIHKSLTNADVYYDDKNFGHAPGMYALYGSFLASRLIATTQRNLTLLQDINFWKTGEEGKGQIITEADKHARRIILPGGEN